MIVKEVLNTEKFKIKKTENMIEIINLRTYNTRHLFRLDNKNGCFFDLSCGNVNCPDAHAIALRLKWLKLSNSVIPITKWIDVGYKKYRIEQKNGVFYLKIKNLYPNHVFCEEESKVLSNADTAFREFLRKKGLKQFEKKSCLNDWFRRRLFENGVDEYHAIVLYKKQT